MRSARFTESKRFDPSSSNSDTPPNVWSTSPVCTRRMRLPSLTQALPDPAKLMSASLLVVFSRLAICAMGGATYSPIPYMTSAMVRPARPTGHAMRHTETPEARVTTSSLPAARFPKPISAPIIAPIGSTVVADTDIALLTDEDKEGAQSHQHGERHGRVHQHGAIQITVERIHALLDSRKTRYRPRPSTARCTHHTPTAGGSSPFSTQTLAAESRFEYTKYTTMANPTRAYRPCRGRRRLNGTATSVSTNAINGLDARDCSCAMSDAAPVPHNSRVGLVSGSCGPITSAGVEIGMPCSRNSMTRNSLVPGVPSYRRPLNSVTKCMPFRSP